MCVEEPAISVSRPMFEIAAKVANIACDKGIPNNESISPPTIITMPYRNKNANVLFTIV